MGKLGFIVLKDSTHGFTFFPSCHPKDRGYCRVMELEIVWCGGEGAAMEVLCKLTCGDKVDKVWSPHICIALGHW
jgi:hypothetical protein